MRPSQPRYVLPARSRVLIVMLLAVIFYLLVTRPVPCSCSAQVAQPPSAAPLHRVRAPQKHTTAPMSALSLSTLTSYSLGSSVQSSSSYPLLSRARAVTREEALALAQADARALPLDAPPECAAWLNATELQAGFTSQLAQDSSIYYSFFAGKLARGERGTYVDIGAHDARFLSNTYFFDRCLGWSGVCFEADPILAAGLSKSNRTCTVVNKCANNAISTLPYVTNHANGHVAGPGEKGNVDVECAPLSELLAEVGIAHADFLSIDIEGNEVTALSNTDWDAIPIEMILVEMAWSSEQLDMLLHDGGYWKITDIAYLDDLYIRGPRLLHSVVHTPERVGNWKWIADFEKRKGRCIKREPSTLTTDESGKIVYTGMGGISLT